MPRRVHMVHIRFDMFIFVRIPPPPPPLPSPNNVKSTSMVCVKRKQIRVFTPKQTMVCLFLWGERRLQCLGSLRADRNCTYSVKMPKVCVTLLVRLRETQGVNPKTCNPETRKYCVQYICQTRSRLLNTV